MPTENTLWSGHPAEASTSAPPTCHQCPSRIWRHEGLLYVSGVRATHAAVWPKSKLVPTTLPSRFQPDAMVPGPPNRLWFELLCLEHGIQASIDGATTTMLEWSASTPLSPDALEPIHEESTFVEPPAEEGAAPTVRPGEEPQEPEDPGEPVPKG